MSKIIESSVNATLATATAAAGVGLFSSENIVSIGALIGAGLAWAVKLYMDWRGKKREADAADAKVRLEADMAELEARRKADQDGVLSWKKMIADAAQEVGDARSELKSAKAQIANLEAQNGSQANQIRTLEEKVGKLAVSQNEVIDATNRQQSKVKSVAKRVDAVEQAMGSSSDQFPPTEPSTAIELPNIE